MLDKSKPQTSHNKRRCCLIQLIKALCKGYSTTLAPRIERKPTLKSIHISVVMILAFFTMFAVLSNSVRASMKVERKPNATTGSEIFSAQNLIDLPDVQEIITMHGNTKIHKFDIDGLNKLHVTSDYVQIDISKQKQEITCNPEKDLESESEQVQNMFHLRFIYIWILHQIFIGFQSSANI